MSKEHKIMKQKIELALEEIHQMLAKAKNLASECRLLDEKHKLLLDSYNDALASGDSQAMSKAVADIACNRKTRRTKEAEIVELKTQSAKPKTVATQVIDEGNALQIKLQEQIDRLKEQGDECESEIFSAHHVLRFVQEINNIQVFPNRRKILPCEQGGYFETPQAEQTEAPTPPPQKIPEPVTYGWGVAIPAERY
jgi:hypothetical protein